MSIREYVQERDVEGKNEHYRKGIRSLLKLHTTVADHLLNGDILLIDAMLLAWLPHKQQLEWLSVVLGGDNSLVYYISEEPSS